jgi:glutamine amidotransferase
VGACATISDQPEAIAAADRLILPGVGAFGDAMRELNSRHLVEPIIEFIRRGRPFLGICLGLQLLFETGEEGGVHAGLGVIPGRVRRFELPPQYKVPHMGWNRVSARQTDGQLLEGLPENPYFYFVHSYYVQPQDESFTWLSCDYGGEFCAAVARENLFATQFHPEKSQSHGLKLLENFSKLTV